MNEGALKKISELLSGPKAPEINIDHFYTTESGFMELVRQIYPNLNLENISFEQLAELTSGNKEQVDLKVLKQMHQDWGNKNYGSSSPLLDSLGKEEGE